MKKPISITAILCLALSLQAQWQVRTLPEVEDVHSSPVAYGNHYYGILSETYYVPYPGEAEGQLGLQRRALCRWDKDMHIVQRFQFPDQPNCSYYLPVLASDRLYLAGYEETAAGERVCQLRCFSHDLRPLWSRQVNAPGSTTTCGLGLKVDLLPDGDLLARVPAPTQNITWIARLSPEGQPKWMQTYVPAGSISYSLGHPILLEDGGLLLTGTTQPSPTQQILQPTDLTVWKIDYATGNLIWERKHRFPQQHGHPEKFQDHFMVLGAVRLADGNIGMVGRYTTHDGKYACQRNLVCRMDVEANVQDYRIWSTGDNAVLGSLVCLADGSYLVGSENTTQTAFGHPNTQWMEVLQLDAQFQAQLQQRIDLPYDAFNSYHLRQGAGQDLVMLGMKTNILLKRP